MDAELRALERRWEETKSPHDELAWLRARLRVEAAPPPELVKRALELDQPAAKGHWLTPYLHVLDGLLPAVVHPQPMTQLGRYLVLGPRGADLACWDLVQGDLCRLVVCGGSPSEPIDEDALVEAMSACVELRVAGGSELLGWSAAPLPYLIEADHPGPTLTEHVLGPQPLGLALEWVEKVSRAVAVGHAQGLVHGRVDSDSVSLVEQREPRLQAFGGDCLSRGTRVSSLHQVGGLVGAFHAWSAEGVCGYPLLPQSDVWQLGVLLFWLLGGEWPFGTAPSLTERAKRIVFDPPRPLLELRPELSPDVVRVVERCLVKAPLERYPDAQALAEDLARLRAGFPVEDETRARELGQEDTRRPRPPQPSASPGRPTSALRRLLRRVLGGSAGAEG
jgi:hypothetical protein